MLIFEPLVVKSSALVLLAAVLSMAVPAWSAPPTDGGATPTPRPQADERFRQADTDGNGLLSKSEAERGAPHVAKHFDAMDANKDGQVARDEVRAFAQARRAARGEKTK